jgi:hypothetical protein
MRPTVRQRPLPVAATANRLGGCVDDNGHARGRGDRDRIGVGLGEAAHG